MTCKPSSSWGPPYRLYIARVGQYPPSWLRMVGNREERECNAGGQQSSFILPETCPPSPRLHSLTFKKGDELQETWTEVFHVAECWIDGVAQQFCSSYWAQKTYLCTPEFSELGQKTGRETLRCLSQPLMELKYVRIPDKVVLLFSMVEPHLVSTCRN